MRRPHETHAKAWTSSHTDALTLAGALLVADSCVVDGTDLYRIALKTLAHEFRKLRCAQRQRGNP
jgi:hypothetical protein